MAAFLAVAAGAGWLYWNVAKSLPDHRLASETSSWTGCLPEGSNRQFVPLTAIPSNVVNAFLAAEDPDFFNRPAYIPGERTGSNVSFMYVRELLACHGGAADHALWHFKFALLTYRVERDLPKRNILETVINSMYFGRGSYGITAGAEAYFGKPLNALSLAEMAFLADVLKEPSYHGGSFPPADKVLNRRNKVLEAMLHMGAISQQQAEAAKLEPLGLQERRPVSNQEP